MIIAERLLAEPCDANAANNAGQAALMMAALFGRTDTAKLLIAHGANPALRDNAGNTSVGLAEQQGNDEMVALLGGR
jgi:ankyrin repeat protein